jgi:hypothetical protein
MTVEELGALPAASLQGEMDFTRSLDTLVLALRRNTENVSSPEHTEGVQPL